MDPFRPQGGECASASFELAPVWNHAGAGKRADRSKASGTAQGRQVQRFGKVPESGNNSAYREN